MQLGAAAQREEDQAVSPPSLPPRPCPAPPAFLIHPPKASLLPGGQCHPHLCHLPPVTAPSGSWGSHNPRSCHSCCCHIQPVQPTAPPDTQPRADRPKDAKKPISDTTQKHGPHSLPPLRPARVSDKPYFYQFLCYFPPSRQPHPSFYHITTTTTSSSPGWTQLIQLCSPLPTRLLQESSHSHTPRPRGPAHRTCTDTRPPPLQKLPHALGGQSWARAPKPSTAPDTASFPHGYKTPRAGTRRRCARSRAPSGSRCGLLWLFKSSHKTTHNLFLLRL